MNLLLCYYNCVPLVPTVFCYVSFYWNIYCYFIKYTDILLLNTNYFIQHQYDILVLKLCSWLVSAELLLSLSGIVALSQIIAVNPRLN